MASLRLYGRNDVSCVSQEKQRLEVSVLVCSIIPYQPLLSLMIVTVHQPQYLPWLGYFDKIDQADVFVVLDNVQFEKNGWQNRNKIKTAQGVQWLTVPVHHRFGQRLDEVRLDARSHWARKHWMTLLTNYGKAPCFSMYRDFFEGAYRMEWDTLVDVSLHFISYLIQALGIKTDVQRASDMVLTEEPNQRLIEICQHLGADTYLAGIGGKQYMEVDRFTEQGIEVRFQSYEHPIYTQLFGDFEPNMSVIDLLFSCGPESLGIIRKGRKEFV